MSAYGTGTYGSGTYGTFGVVTPTLPPGTLEPLLEFAPDPLSVVAPAYVDVTSELIDIEWWSGKSNELGDPEPGGMRALLLNRNRRFEPEYVAGMFYPDIDTERRFRFTLTDSAGAEQQGVWYTESWEIDYPTGEEFSLVTVTCVDGFGLLTNDTLPHLDPPDATDYASVVDFDQPVFNYRLGEDAGTKMVSHTRRVKRRGEMHRIKRKWRTVETRAEVEGQSGPSGTYVNNPTLGEPGAILGDPDTSVLFEAARQQWARVPLDEENTISRNRLTVEAWAKCRATNLAGGIVGGPQAVTVAQGVFDLSRDGPSGVFLGNLFFTDGTTQTVAVFDATAPPAEWNHFVMTYDGVQLLLYANGVLADSDEIHGKTLRASDPTESLKIGRAIGVGYFDGWIDEVAVYEKVLSPERVLAHYQAGAERGFDREGTGARIEAIAASPLWSTAGIAAGTFEIQPQMMSGQGKLDAILEATAAERPRSLFYFDGEGNPIYRGFKAQDGAAVAVTFGDASPETHYSAIAPVYDNEVFNTVVGSIDGGELQEATDAQSILDRKPRVRDAETSMPLAEPDDVQAVISAIASEYGNPTQRLASVTVLGVDVGRISHILRRQIGDVARIKRRGEGGTPIYRQSAILGYRKHMDARSRLLSCQYDFARGFNASQPVWRLGATGFTELGQTTVLG